MAVANAGLSAPAVALRPDRAAFAVGSVNTKLLKPSWNNLAPMPLLPPLLVMRSSSTLVNWAGGEIWTGLELPPVVKFQPATASAPLR